jgi:hypothetical protein
MRYTSRLVIRNKGDQMNRKVRKASLRTTKGIAPQTHRKRKEAKKAFPKKSHGTRPFSSIDYKALPKENL